AGLGSGQRQPGVCSAGRGCGWDGFGTPGGYRVSLWQRHAVDFVGSASNGPPGLGDHDHEGHSGFRIDQLDAGIVSWVRRADPRTVLLFAGTNDLNQRHDVAGAPARLGALVDRIHALAPLAEVFVAQLTPVPGDPAFEARVRAFNAALPAIVRGPRTHLVDMHSGFTAADLDDGLHPNATGYAKMADRWAAALESVPGSLSPATGTPAVLSSPLSLRCLDDALVLRDCSGAPSQIWDRFSLSPAGALVTADGRCLEASGIADGSAVRPAECRGTANQRWSAR
ncbi:GDSL-type esterase/lipase family protein, partial [Lentzea sp. NPDC006480]|uniref:GDSL-type esterase/lipase family protein n=1 Tax=Lentzea sp. NPDC006480 TaxID=3157176 RepID=UPI00339EC890